MAAGDHPDNLRTRQLRPSGRRPVFLRTTPNRVRADDCVLDHSRLRGPASPLIAPHSQYKRKVRINGTSDNRLCISTVSAGSGANQSLMSQIADIGQGERFHAEGSV